MAARDGRTIACVIILCVAGVIGVAEPVHAQRGRIAGPPRFDVTLGGGVVTGVALGEADANIRANATALQDYRLFSSETRLRPAPVVDVRLAGVVTGRLAIEGQLHFGRPQLETAITSDVESAADVTVSERLSQVMLGAGVRVRLDNIRRQSRTMPYVSAGAAVLRQTPAAGGDVQQSRMFYAGGGVRHVLGRRPLNGGGAGVRADAQVLMGKAALSVDEKVRPQLALTAGVFFSF